MGKELRHKVFVSSLLNSTGKDVVSIWFRDLYNELKKDLNDNLIPIKNTSDIWMRDYMPIQIDENTFVTYLYKPDYLSCQERHGYITKRFSSSHEIFINKGKYSNIEESHLPFHRPDVSLRECRLILDGGNIVLCGDKIILTDKVFIENRPKTPEYVIGELERAFGKEVIIIPSDPYEIIEARKNDELPLCHADGVLAPIDNETILIADYGDDPLGYVPQLMNVLTRYFKPDNIKHFDFSKVSLGEKIPDEVWVYINFLKVGDLILVPQLGEDLKEYDEEAIRQLKIFFKMENVKGINTRLLSLGKDKEMINDNNGGALHCITWEVKID